MKEAMWTKKDEKDEKVRKGPIRIIRAKKDENG